MSEAEARIAGLSTPAKQKALEFLRRNRQAWPLNDQYSSLLSDLRSEQIEMVVDLGRAKDWTLDGKVLHFVSRHDEAVYQAHQAQIRALLDQLHSTAQAIQTQTMKSLHAG